MLKTITYFTGLQNPCGEQRNIDIDQFLANPILAAKKALLPLFTFATFVDCYRDTKHFESTEMLGFDVDVPPIPNEEQLRAALLKSGLTCYYHTSSSATEQNPRWRVFVQCEHKIAANEYKTAHAQVRQLFNFPVGAQAIDPARAWFVPAKTNEGVYVWGKVLGENLQVTEGKSAEANNAPIALQTLNLDPDEETHEKILTQLTAVWPKIGTRDACHLALAGTLARWGFSKGYTIRIIKELSARTGSDKGEQRATMVYRTFDKLANGEGVAAWTKLCESIGEENANALREQLKIRLPDFLSVLASAEKGHKYSYSIGDAPAIDLKKATISDIVTTLVAHPDWKGVLRWNTITATICAVNPPVQLEAEEDSFSSADITRIRMWLEAYGISAGFEAISQALEVAAKTQMWNPLTDYFEACPDTPGAIDSMAEKAFGLTDELSKQMLKKQLIAAIRRAQTKEGVKVDTILVLKSPQGWNKTQFIDVLFGEKYVTKNLSDIKKKDSSQELRGIWAVEFGELASIATADIETLKEFLSRAVDKYRPTYGQIKISVPRNCVFWGTTNAESFLKDETGNRRFWVIVLTQAIDLEYVRAHRNEIWGEAYALAKAGEPHWFTRIKEQEAEERNHDFLSIDAWADPIYGYCLGKTFVRTDQIYQMAICGGDINAAKTLDERAQRRISRVLTILGAKSSTKRIDGRVLRVWQLPVTFCAELRIAENNKDVTVVTPNVNDSAEKDCPQNAFLQVLAKFRN